MKKENRVIQENRMVKETSIRSSLPDRIVLPQHMTADSKLPTGVQQGLEEAGLNHRSILPWIDTDISLDGRLMREWLVVTGDHLAVVVESTVGDRSDAGGWVRMTGVRVRSLQKGQGIAAFFQRATCHTHAIGRVKPCPDILSLDSPGQQISIGFNHCGDFVRSLVQ